MQRIYIDVTNVLQTDYVTGIQRVVRSVIREMMERIPDRLELLVLTPQLNSFRLLDKKLFMEYIQGECAEKQRVYSGKVIFPSEIRAGDIFFDLDSVWNLPYKRSALLPELKGAGVRLAVYIYDVIPITNPQFCHVDTLFNFLDYLGAYLQYADVLIASAQSTLDEINKLIEKLGLNPIPGYVSWLGSDFRETPEEDLTNIPQEVREAASDKYVLCIGTIEPRKNHKLLLDAFDRALFAKGIRLIFAGKLGWNVEELEKRIRDHKYLGKQFFHFTGLGDDSVDYLYRHAYMVAFPTYNEGFGLPIVEALERGVPVLTSRKPVLQEIGKDYCDYFDPDDPQEFVDRMEYYLGHPEAYEKVREHIREFQPFTWKETAERIVEALNTITNRQYTPKQELRQMVILSARPEALRDTLPFVDAFMPFIEEVVICCPDSMTGAMEQCYHGRMKLTTLTDGQLLNGRPLPKDHEQRNFLLRCLAMRSDALDDVFVMSDDDYRPLGAIAKSQFVTERNYRAYYFYRIDRWKGTTGSMTSYDHGMFRTRDFLKAHHYPCKQYSSHMPQVIDRQLYCEMLDKHPGMEEQGLCEWSTYFNYVQYSYPDLLSAEPYVTLGWPGSGTDWSMEVQPQNMLFENYYESLYEPGGIFEGFSGTYYEGIEVENQQKVAKARAEQRRYQIWQEQFEHYRKKYAVEHGELPPFVIRCEKGQVYLTLPRTVDIPLDGFVRVPFAVYNPESADLRVNYRYVDEMEHAIMEGTAITVDKTDQNFELPIFGMRGSRSGKYKLIIEVRCADQQYEGGLTAFCV